MRVAPPWARPHHDAVARLGLSNSRAGRRGATLQGTLVFMPFPPTNRGADGGHARYLHGPGVASRGRHAHAPSKAFMGVGRRWRPPTGRRGRCRPAPLPLPQRGCSPPSTTPSPPPPPHPPTSPLPQRRVLGRRRCRVAAQRREGAFDAEHRRRVPRARRERRPQPPPVGAGACLPRAHDVVKGERRRARRGGIHGPPVAADAAARAGEALLRRLPVRVVVVVVPLVGLPIVVGRAGGGGGRRRRCRGRRRRRHVVWVRHVPHARQLRVDGHEARREDIDGGRGAVAAARQVGRHVPDRRRRRRRRPRRVPLDGVRLGVVRVVVAAVAAWRGAAEEDGADEGGDGHDAGNDAANDGGEVDAPGLGGGGGRGVFAAVGCAR
ncbi:hypothetical protein BU14_0303s0008 [Porphyra umbilicalis]|uniref:Uncharacterized protein n=1 Tax=Porphyra umbilicalis TaxID=2786 RepID=A0A1X6P087_PORUM|nr:hypothetical protein BU14_0303s0008 [Porphyra umbilicalis]|eukprot:OSX74176.1 hypothetical protein BU14_0303s0008 [Porphyra umbilicalis]